MNPDQDLQPNDLNEVADLTPIELPGRDPNPTLDQRMAAVESILNIS